MSDKAVASVEVYAAACHFSRFRHFHFKQKRFGTFFDFPADDLRSESVASHFGSGGEIFGISEIVEIPQSDEAGESLFGR